MITLSKERFFLLLLFVLSGNLFGQSALDLRINEIQAINDSGYIDDFGKTSPWIEVFNTAFNYVNIGGCYLTDDPSNPTKYKIPKGDPITLIAPRNYIVFWADNEPTHGILHLNFSLEIASFLALYDADGKTLIDSLHFPAQKPDVSYGRQQDGSRQWDFLPKITPNANNDTALRPTAAQKFQEIDPVGIGMAMMAMAVVFLVLLMLYLVFNNFSGAMQLFAARKEARLQSVASIPELPPDETIAAIGLALSLYIKELQEHEDMILTIKKVSRTYSPWNSKIYGVGSWPRSN